MKIRDFLWVLFAGRILDDNEDIGAFSEAWRRGRAIDLSAIGE